MSYFDCLESRLEPGPVSHDTTAPTPRHAVHACAPPGPPPRWGGKLCPSGGGEAGRNAAGRTLPHTSHLPISASSPRSASAIRTPRRLGRHPAATTSPPSGEASCCRNIPPPAGGLGGGQGESNAAGHTSHRPISISAIRPAQRLSDSIPLPSTHAPPSGGGWGDCCRNTAGEAS